jgi:hypothetical protein
VGQAGKKTWKTEQDLGVVDKEMSLLSAIDNGCEINRFIYQG